MYLQTLLQTLEITLPVILLVVLGVVLKTRGAIDERFIATASRLVFNVSLPVLMFMAIVSASASLENHGALVVFALLAALSAFALTLIVARVVKVSTLQYGAFVQASFRSNLGIIGLALCINAFPVEGALLGAIILAVVTPLYNFLSVWVLAGGDVGWKGQIIATVKNPLIIAIALAALVNVSGFTLPQFALSTGSALAAMTLPLALIGIGGSLVLPKLSLPKQEGRNNVTLLSVALKILILPSLIIMVAVMSGIRGPELMVLAIMFSSPTAAAAFVMASAMGADEKLTANVIAISTLGAAVSMTSFIYVLNLSGLV
ncbi:MAG: AEC family transporter [Thalassolituus sp.]|jgi:predicted permease